MESQVPRRSPIKAWTPKWKDKVCVCVCVSLHSLSEESLGILFWVRVFVAGWVGLGQMIIFLKADV